MSRSADIPQRAEDKFQIFEKWLLENGADFSKVRDKLDSTLDFTCDGVFGMFWENSIADGS